MRPLLYAFLLTILAAQPALAQSLQVALDQAERVALPSAARDVIIGNPAIADVTVIDEYNVLVLGKGYGMTNLLVIGRNGATLINREVVVAPADSGQINFYRGAALAHYNCSPRCTRTPMPGENTDTYQPYATTATAYSGRAEGAATSGGNSTP